LLLPARIDIDPSLLFFSLLGLAVSGWIAFRNGPLGSRVRLSDSQAMLELMGVSAFAVTICAIAHASVTATIVPFTSFLALAFFIRHSSMRLSMPGAAWLASQFCALSVAWLWTCAFVSESGLPGWMVGIAVSGLTVGLVVGLLGCIERIAREAILTHERWQLPLCAPRDRALRKRYRVSIHLPCYAEPPEVVKETMNRLAALDYDNFEVLVCDNNTRDEALWRPLEAHCRVLNQAAGEERFRFFHVSPLPGAKAGALNFCLEQMDPATDIVAVVDADYFSRPDFLTRLLPFFDNAGVGYVQTPHDYREHEGNPYLTACYWEYMPNNKVDMSGVSEYGGAFTIGTMCLLRADVLKAIGGWAEWCLTEDSEVSVRLREAGFRGIYLRETFGRGLIPSNFDDYKKQRFRWTAGPVQQLRRHWRLFLPAPWAKPMPGWTKLLEVLRCIAPLQNLVGVVFGLLMLAATTVAVATGTMKPVSVPLLAWLMLGLAVATWMVRTWHRYVLSGCTRLRDMVLGELARASLTYVVLMAGVAGLSNKPLAWRRTPKFGAKGGMRSAIAAALPETVLGVLSLGAAITTLFAAPLIGGDVAAFTALAIMVFAVSFLAAPFMALLALAEERQEKAAAAAAPAMSRLAPALA